MIKKLPPPSQDKGLSSVVVTDQLEASKIILHKDTSYRVQGTDSSY